MWSEGHNARVQKNSNVQYIYIYDYLDIDKVYDCDLEDKLVKFEASNLPKTRGLIVCM